MMNWTIVALDVLKDYGLYGLAGIAIFVSLLCLVKYQEKRRLIAEEKHRVDWKEIHDNHRVDREKDQAMHRKDRDEWIDDMKTIQESCLSEIIKTSKASNDVIRSNTQALTILSVRIESCTK